MERHDGIAREVQALDAPVQMAEQLPNVVQFFATLLPWRAEDLASRSSAFVSRRVTGGTAGGSADRIPLLFCSGLWSSTLTFQFLLVVEGETPVFKVLPRTEFNSNGFFCRTHF